MGLASIGAGALFALHDGAAVSTTGALANDGNVVLDPNAGDGGSSLTLAGALTNSFYLSIGNATLSASDKVAAASLDNTGKIVLNGSSANQALLDVTGSAGFGTAGVLSGNVELAGDSAIEFASGEITSLEANAQLHLNGNDAFIEDSTALGSNSALTGLASIGAGATFDLENEASVSTTGSLANDGTINLDANPGDGGSSLTVAGALTNSGSLNIGVSSLYGSAPLSASDEVTAASLDNTGSIYLRASGASQALLDVTAGSAEFGAAGVLSGSVTLENDSAIEFARGQISTIAASSALTLIGNDAFIEDSTALGSNSALTGLANIAGSLALSKGASVSTTGALTNSGVVHVAGFTTGCALSIAGALTNTGRLDIDPGGSLTAKSFVNRGTVGLSGGSFGCALNVSGALTNNGSISIGGNGSAELAGAVGGTGSFHLSPGSFRLASLQFDSSVSAGQTINETGNDPYQSDALVLEQAQSFAATIKGFGTADTIDATNFVETATSHSFLENSMGTGGTLSLHDASLTANILMTGDYSNSSFTLAPDSGTGTLVKFV